MKAYWNSKTIYRKVVMIAMAIQLIGWFIFPIAKMYRATSSMNNIAKKLGIDILPEKFTLFSLAKFMSDMGSSDGNYYFLVIILNAVLLCVIVMGKKRAGYIVSFLLWNVVALFSGIGISAAGSVSGYEGKPFMTLLIYAITAVVMVGCLLGAIFEYKAQAKLAARGTDGYAPSAGDGKIDTEKLKEQAGNLADTGAAVAKKTAKAAIKGFHKASSAAKDFVETAKNESNAEAAKKSTQAAPAPAAAVPKPQPAELKKPAIAQTGSITGVRGMFAGAQIPIAHGESVVIGRAADSCHIILENDGVSKKHCVIQYDGTTGNYVVTDYSTNGTYLGNGSRLQKTEPTVLTPGAVLWIGNKENTFQLG